MNTTELTGRELDAAVARAMGWTFDAAEGWWVSPDRELRWSSGKDAPPFSGDDWHWCQQVVERMRELGWDGSVCWYRQGDTPTVAFAANFWRSETLENEFSAYSPTAPEAICRAALAAIGATECSTSSPSSQQHTT